IWHKLCDQQMQYYDKNTLDAPQTLDAVSPATTNTHGQYDTVVINADQNSNWPRQGLKGHTVAQLHLIFCPLNLDLLVAYIQCFDIIPQARNVRNVNTETESIRVNIKLLHCSLVLKSLIGFNMSNSVQSNILFDQKLLTSHAMPYAISCFVEHIQDPKCSTGT
ncbi:hypothetical protein OG21DRAFT_1527528, partial [Imleria badia]